jgi:hypothetical protein
VQGLARSAVQASRLAPHTRASPGQRTGRAGGHARVNEALGLRASQSDLALAHTPSKQRNGAEGGHPPARFAPHDA